MIRLKGVTLIAAVAGGTSMAALTGGLVGQGGPVMKGNWMGKALVLALAATLTAFPQFATPAGGAPSNGGDR